MTKDLQNKHPTWNQLETKLKKKSSQEMTSFTHYWGCELLAPPKLFCIVA